MAVISSFLIIVSFLTKLLTLWILFSTAVRALVVAKLLQLGISPVTCFSITRSICSKVSNTGILPLTSFILVLRVDLVGKLVTSDILSSVFFILALYTSFSTKLFFTTSLSLLKSTGTGSNLSISNLSIFFSSYLN